MWQEFRENRVASHYTEKIKELENKFRTFKGNKQAEIGRLNEQINQLVDELKRKPGSIKQDLNGTTVLDGVKGAAHKATPQEKVALIIYRNAHNLYKTDADRIATEIFKSGELVSSTELHQAEQETARKVLLRRFNMFRWLWGFYPQEKCPYCGSKLSEHTHGWRCDNLECEFNR